MQWRANAHKELLTNSSNPEKYLNHASLFTGHVDRSAPNVLLGNDLFFFLQWTMVFSCEHSAVINTSPTRGSLVMETNEPLSAGVNKLLTDLAGCCGADRRQRYTDRMDIFGMCCIKRWSMENPIPISYYLQLVFVRSPCRVDRMSVSSTSPVQS